MKSKILGLLAVALLAGPVDVNAAVISGTWTFTAGAYSGTFSFSGLDTSQSYVDSTAAGFSLSTNFDTTGNGGNAFSTNGFGPGSLIIGGLVGGLGLAQGAENDWFVYSFDLLQLEAGGFAYYPAPGAGQGTGFAAATFRVTAVPEPGSLALLGLGLLGLGFTRRRARQAAKV